MRADHLDGHQRMWQVPRGGVLEEREIMRRSIAGIGVLAALLCLWTVVAHAVTLHVTDDTFTQKEAPTTQSGAAASLSINNKNLTKEHITYTLFDLSLLPPSAPIDRAVLRFFVNQVAQPGKLKFQWRPGGCGPSKR
jgi:hypothetical protein